MSELKPLLWVLHNYRDGDEQGWEQEFHWLQRNHAERLLTLYRQIAHDGILEPVELGSDGRVWNGHHRLCVAYMMQIFEVPVVFSRREE